MLLWPHHRIGRKNFPYESRFINFYAVYIRSTGWKIRDAIYTAHRADSIEPSFTPSAIILEKFREKLTLLAVNNRDQLNRSSVNHLHSK